MVSPIKCPHCGGTTHRPLQEPTVECQGCGQSFSAYDAGMQQPPAVLPPARWWMPPLAIGILGMLVVGFFVFPAVDMGALFSLFGLAMLGAAVHEFVSTLRLVRVAIPADGIVVGFEERLEESDDEKHVHFYPRVEFQTEDHGKQLFTSDDGSRKASYHIGARVRVLYDPARPQVARIDKHLWWPPVTAAVFGTVFLVPGLRMLLIGLGLVPGEIHWD